MDEQHEQQYHHDGEQQQGGEGEAQPPPQADGAFARINGGMMQSGKFTDQIVSLVGQVTAHDTIRSADGSNVQVITEHLSFNDDDDNNNNENNNGEEGGSGSGGGLIVDPNMCVEIMGQVSSPTTITAFVCRYLGSDMDLSLYNQSIVMQQQDKYVQYFSPAANMPAAN